MTRASATPETIANIGAAAGEPYSFDWLISPEPRKKFWEQYWEKQALVVKRNQPEYFSSLFCLDEVDRVLTTLNRRYPDIVLKNADTRVDESEYTLSGGVLDIAKVYQLFEQGSTISLAFLDDVVPELTLLCRTLESDFSFPLQTNIYLTPPGAQGARPHYDTHDVFVLQISGSKKWTIFGRPLESPLASQNFNAPVHDLGAATLEFELEAGDVAYIPRGLAHEARSTDAVSLHITAGVLQYTWAELLLEAVAVTAASDPALRKAIPPGFARSGFDRSHAKQTLSKLLQQTATSSDLDAVFDCFVDRFTTACPPLLNGQLAQLGRLDRLTLASVVGARPGVISRLETVDHTEVLHCYNRKITFPSQTREALRFALSQPRFTVRALAGNLNEAGKLTLIRRLIREGLVIALPD